MNENDANLANYSELADHVKDIEARLGGLGRNEDQKREELNELRADYYERAIQVRQMRCTTLEEEIASLTGQLQREAGGRYSLIRQRRAAFTTILCALVAWALDAMCPEWRTNAVGFVTSDSFVSHASAAAGGWLVF